MNRKQAIDEAKKKHFIMKTGTGKYRVIGNDIESHGDYHIMKYICRNNRIRYALSLLGYDQAVINSIYIDFCGSLESILSHCIYMIDNKEKYQNDTL
jgi:hypothetical protein